MILLERDKVKEENKIDEMIKNKIVATSVALVLFFVLGIFAWLFNVFSIAFLVQKTYSWFIGGYFLPLKEISLVHSLGLVLFVRSLTFIPKIKDIESKKTELSRTIGYIIGLMVYPWIILLFAYLIHLFI